LGEERRDWAGGPGARQTHLLGSANFRDELRERTLKDRIREEIAGRPKGTVHRKLVPQQENFSGWLHGPVATPGETHLRIIRKKKEERSGQKKIRIKNPREADTSRGTGLARVLRRQSVSTH